MSSIRLFTPGPVQIPEYIIEAMRKPAVHHRTPDFESTFIEAQERLQALVNGTERPLFLTCSGTGGLEASLINCCGTGDSIGFISAGKFGERWGEIAKQHGIEAVPLIAEWGESPSIDAVRSFLQAHTDLKAFCVQYCETSTTVLHDVPAIASLLKEEFPNMLFLVDAISAATALPIDQQKLGIDALVLASQKAFMLPPGLSMISLSERYWAHAENVNPASLYFNFHLERKSQLKGQSAWTPALTLVYGLLEVMKHLETEGYEASYSRHQKAAERCRTGLTQCGFTLVTNHPSPTVTGAYPPAGLKADALRSKLLSESGIRIAGGQGLWKGKVIRIGHMGMISEHDIDYCLAQLKEVLP